MGSRAEAMPVPTAQVVLGGHQGRPARLEVMRYSHGWRFARTVAAVLAWWGSTVATLVFTFDPFVASFPLLLGCGMVWKSWRGRFRVEAFDGACPRCETRLEVKSGSRISLPHPLVCYHCHHEPVLVA